MYYGISVRRLASCPGQSRLFREHGDCRLECNILVIFFFALVLFVYFISFGAP